MASWRGGNQRYCMSCKAKFSGTCRERSLGIGSAAAAQRFEPLSPTPNSTFRPHVPGEPRRVRVPPRRAGFPGGGSRRHCLQAARQVDGRR